MSLVQPHRRSVGFLQREGESWACFLVTQMGRDGRWYGYFSFRPGSGETKDDSVRTAQIYVESEEAEIHRKARELGRPLLLGLLESALHTAGSDGRPTALRSRFRVLLRDESLRLSEAGRGEASNGELDLRALRSLYASYRFDQVTHFICLVGADDFSEAVDRILEGKRIDFGARDRVQFAMLVVQEIESLLPLPPFEVWMEDYLSDPGAYLLYTHTLHREGRLP